MTAIKIVGQAPARSGDGRPFTGPSGQRLTRLMGLTNYDALATRFDLVNLLRAPVGKAASGRGDTFDRAAAERQAQYLMRQWAVQPDLIVAIACGHEVFRCLTHTQVPFFEGKALKLGPAQFVDVWCFPHPSGSSAFWNDNSNQRLAAEFLNRLVKHYGRPSTR